MQLDGDMARATLTVGTLEYKDLYHDVKHTS